MRPLRKLVRTRRLVRTLGPSGVGKQTRDHLHPPHLRRGLERDARQHDADVLGVAQRLGLARFRGRQLPRPLPVESGLFGPRPLRHERCVGHRHVERGKARRQVGAHDSLRAHRQTKPLDGPAHRTAKPPLAVARRGRRIHHPIQ